MKVGSRLHAKQRVSDADVLTVVLLAAAAGSVRPTSPADEIERWSASGSRHRRDHR